MINAGEDLLICDLAETYGVYDYKTLRPTVVAALAAGLRADSRIRMRLAGLRVPLNEMLLATIADHLATLCWMNTKDAPKGKNRPQSILETLLHDPDEDPVAFDSVDDFNRRREEILKETWQKDMN